MQGGEYWRYTKNTEEYEGNIYIYICIYRGKRMLKEWGILEECSGNARGLSREDRGSAKGE